MSHRAVKLSLSIVLALTALFSQTISSVSQGLGPAGNNATKTVLNNGLTLILKEDRRSPTFALSLFARAGSAAESEYSGAGITHFIEHMLFKGTATRDAGQIESQIKSYGAEVGAYTTFDYTAFKMEGPSDNLLPLLDIFYDIVANSKFDENEFEKEKNVIKKEIGLIQDDPAKYLSQQFWQTAYLIHPYHNPIIGYEEVLDRLTPKDLRAHYEKVYIPNNMVLVVVGDIDSAAVGKKVDETFGRLSRKSRPESVLPQEPNQVAPRYREIPYPISKAYMMLGFHSVDLASEDLYALDVLAILLGEGNSSILYQNLHDRLNLVYSIGAYNYTPFNPGIFVISATYEPGHEDKIIRQLFEEIERLKNSPLKKKELEKARNQVISSYIFSKESQESQVGDLGISQLLTGDMDFSRRYVEGVNSVSPHQVMEVASRYLNREKMTKVVLIPSAIKAVETEAKSKAEAIPQRTVIKKNLRNGIRLVISEDKTLPLVSVRVCIKGGLRAEDKDDNGIANLTAQMLTKGTTSRSEEQIFSLIESLGGSLSAYSGNNSFGLSLDIMSKDIAKGIELLGDILSSPAFAEDKIKILKEDILTQIEFVDDDIFASTEKRLKERLFPDHPYGRLSLGSADSIKKISRRQIINFYKSHCLGSNIVISICGDIDSAQAYNRIASSFNGIRRSPPPELKKIDLVNIEGQIEIKQKLDKKQAVVMAGFRSAGIDNPDRYPLQILSSVFSGGAGKLYANIRQEKGLAYTLGTFGMTGIDAGTFIFYAATSADDLNSVKDEIIAQIKQVREGGIAEQEIDSAKKTIIAKYQIGLQTAGDFALQTALDELYGLGYDSYLHYPEKINSVSLQQIIQIANKYFTLESCVISMTVPEDK